MNLPTGITDLLVCLLTVFLERFVSDTEARCQLDLNGGVEGCPTFCRCTMDNAAFTLVDCSGGMLQSVPANLPPDMVELDLSGNKITTLAINDFKGCNRLKILRLARNQLRSLPPGVFEELLGLRELHLSDNKLTLNDSTYLQTVTKCQQLTILSLHGNVNISEEIFRNLANLTTLTLDYFDSVLHPGSTFRSLNQLQSLTIYGTFKTIRNETFQNLSLCPLKELSIKSNNTLSVLEPLAFADLIYLETLDLSYNRGIGFKNVSNAWYGLQFTNITTLILTRIILDNEVGPYLRQDFYRHLNLCKGIKTLLINRNNIVGIEMGLSTAFHNVEHFDFSFNRMSNVGTLLWELQFMRKLRFFDVSYQSKRYINKRSVNQHRPASNDISNALSFETPKNHNSSPALSFCRAAERKPCSIFDMMSIDNETPLPDHGPWCIPLPSRAETINLSMSVNIQLTTLPQITVIGGSNSRVKNVVYRSNGFSQFAGPFYVFGSNSSIPLTLDLGDNGISCLAPDITKKWINDGGNLGGLIFDNNDLGEQLEADADGNVFEVYQQLTELNLPRNNIKALPPKIFTHLSSLSHLNLSGNSLRVINFEFAHLKLLQFLDLSNNLITNLNSEILENLEMLFDSANMTVNFKGNPIQCSCETLSFLNWMQKKNQHLANFEEISCLFNNTQITFDHLSDIVLVRLELMCATQLILKLSATLIGLTLLAIVVSVFFYRHRWDVRYFFLNLRRKDPPTEQVYRYDAFVSYDHRDIKWVRQELLHHLESLSASNTDEATAESSSDVPLLNVANDDQLSSSAASLRLCLADRDFETGEAIQQNIMMAIQQSRKVILVLSKHFIASRWCNFELEMARIHSFERGTNILVPIMLESLRMEDMFTCLKWLVRQYTYVEWKPHSAEREEFWQSLKKVLAQPGLEFWACERSEASGTPHGAAN